MRHRPQERMSYKKRLLLHQAEQAMKDADLAERMEKDPRHCLAEGADGNQCKGWRIHGELYCAGHKRSAKRKHFDHAHEEFTEATPI